VERNRKAGQNPPRVVAPIEEEEGEKDALISQIYFGMKIYMFRTVPLSIIRSFSLYTQQWYMSYSFADSLQAGSGWNILILLASCPQTCN